MDNLISRDKFDAVLFDLDGVLTATARVHATCWKRTFDAFLQQRAEERGQPFRPFEIATDYKLYVDGKARLDGVRSFLESRGIVLPAGDDDEAPDSATVRGIASRKNAMVGAAIAEQGVDVFEGSVALVRQLRNQGFKTAVVSASSNCLAVLTAAGIAELFDARVDGQVAARLRLPGKPAPDVFLAAARELQVSPERCVVVEDAIAGVQSGRAGGFGMVIGVDRDGQREALRQNGADIVVSDLGELLDAPISQQVERP